MKMPRIVNALLMPALLATSGIWPASQAHSMAVLLKGAGGPSVDLSEIQALFIVGDSTTVHLRGHFDGPLRDFVWLLPVPSTSRIELSHNDIFERMNQRTLPRFYLLPEERGFFPLYEERVPKFPDEFVPEFPELTFENRRSQGCLESAYEAFFPISDCFSCGGEGIEVHTTDTREWETQAVTLINARSHAEIFDWALERGYLPGTMDTGIVQSYLDDGHAILAVEVAPPAYFYRHARGKPDSAICPHFSGGQGCRPLEVGGQCTSYQTEIDRLGRCRS